MVSITSIVTTSLLIWVAVWQLSYPQFVAAQTVFPQYATGKVLFSDNFDDADISDWTEQRNFQVKNPSLPCMNVYQPANWLLENGKLGLIVDSPSCIIELTPKQIDLSAEDSFSYTVDVTLSESTAMDRSILFLWQNERNWYDVKLFSGSLEVQKVVNGQVYPPTGTNAQYPFQANQSYQFSVQLTPEMIRVSINGMTVIEAADPTPKLSGPYTIGIKTAVGAVRRSVTWYDNISVSRLVPASADHQLSITPIKQTDPQWKNMEYDSGSTWSADPTIGRWGCALTSMTMLLQYYDISQLPTGENITPASLNQWLKAQPDGYVGMGLLNWLAVTRLTNIVSAQRNTPKLEYQRHSGTDIETASNSVNANKPVVLELPGHFLVGSGVTSDQNDLFITDPAFSYTKLSQHQKPLLSTRLFQPSQTDLSYVLVVSEPELSVTLVTAEGEIQPVDSYLENITAFNEGEATLGTESLPKQRLTILPKPRNGEYTLSFSQQQYGHYQADVYTYTLTGEVTHHQASGYAGPDGNHHQLTLEKNSKSLLEILSNFEQLRSDLQLLFQNKELSSSFDWQQWDRYASLGVKTSSIVTRLRLANLLVTLINRNTKISPAAQTYLTHQLRAIIANNTKKP